MSQVIELQPSRGQGNEDIIWTIKTGKALWGERQSSWEHGQGESADSMRQWGLEHICGKKMKEINKEEKMKAVMIELIRINNYNCYYDSYYYFPACWTRSQSHINTALGTISGWVCDFQAPLLETLPGESWKGQEGRINLNAKTLWMNPVFSTI